MYTLPTGLIPLRPHPLSVHFSHIFLLSFLQGKGEGEVAQSCPTLWDPVDCNLLGFSVHGVLQAGILEWIAISFSRDLPQGPNPGLPHWKQTL